MTPIKRNLNYQFTRFPLRLRIRWNNNTLTISTGYHVDKFDARGKEKWQNNRCKPNTTHGADKISASIINKVLEELENRIDNAFLKYETADTIPTREQLYNELRPNKAAQDIWALFEDFITEGEKLHQWSFNTIRSIRNIKNLFRKSNPDITINTLTIEELNYFVIYQQSHRVALNNNKAEQKGYANNVIKKNCRILKWFLKWAVDKGYIPPALCSSFKPEIKTIKKDVIYLEWDELIKIRDYNFDNCNEKDKARDFFCFCCFTSLRYSDAYRLKKSAIKDGVLTITTQKTNTKLRIELNKRAQKIIDKYTDNDSEFVLPHIKLPWLNQLLKKIGEEIGIDAPITISQYYGNNRIDRTVPKYELLSSHCARRTFISNAFEMGIPAQVVMKWSGHTSMEALKPYLEIADKKKSAEMKKFDSRD